MHNVSPNHHDTTTNWPWITAYILVLLIVCSEGVLQYEDYIDTLKCKAMLDAKSSEDVKKLCES